MRSSPNTIEPREAFIEHITSLFFATLAIVAAAGLFLTSEHDLVEIIFGSVADAYLQVTTFVAGTFLLIYGAERFLKVDAVAAFAATPPYRCRWQRRLAQCPGVAVR